MNDRRKYDISDNEPLMASWRCLGMMRVFLLSLAALTASLRTSAARYSMTAARYTGAAICSFLTRGHQYGDDKSPKNKRVCVCV